MIGKCNVEWSPKTFSGALALGENQYGRTTIIPRLFAGVLGTSLATWRQFITTAAGEISLLTGAGAAGVMAEDFKVAWMGLAFPNKIQHIKELRWNIGDRKYGRINIEELESYNTPALVFEEGFPIDEEQNFQLWGYSDVDPIRVASVGGEWQRIVMLGAAYYKIIDKLLGVPGAVISTT